jgi:hypothetical protein
MSRHEGWVEVPGAAVSVRYLAWTYTYVTVERVRAAAMERGFFVEEQGQRRS